MTWPVYLNLNKNLFYCVWSQMSSRKNLHHPGGGQYWFPPQYIRKLIYWPALNASAQTNSQTSITDHHKSILTDCGGPCMSAQLKTRSRGPTLHLQGRELRGGGGWWAWHCAAHCTHMLISPQTGSDSRTWGRRKPSMHSNERTAASHWITSVGGTVLCQVQGVIQTKIMIISPPHKRWLNSDLWFEWPSIFQRPSFSSLSFLPFLLLTKEWMMHVYWFPINYFYPHFI